MVNTRDMPEFKRWLSQTYGRLGTSWRRPRGKHSKVALKQKSKFRMPSPAYGAPKKLRYLHPSGFREVLVYNQMDLEKVDAKKEAARIAHTVGKKKRQGVIKRAEEMKIKLLNP